MANKLQLNLSGGMNVQTSPLIIKDNECELALNYHLDVVGSLRKRSGMGLFGLQINHNVNVVGLYQFNDQSASASIPLMVESNGGGTATIYYFTGGNWTASGRTTDTLNARARFSSFVDRVFRVNGAQVVITSTDGITWQDSTAPNTNVPATITPKYTAVFQDRVYLANGASSNQSRLWFSSLPSAGAITWDLTNNWIDINPDDGDQITALENNGNRLLIFKNRALYRWTFGQVEPDRLIGVGTQSQESVKTNFDVGITFFANQFGIYAYTSGRPKLISRKIQPFIDAVTDWTAVYGEVDRDHYYLSVGNLTVNGRTYTNAVLVYNIPLDAWSIFTFGCPRITIMARLQAPGDTTSYIVVGTADGRTYKIESLGSFVDINDAGASLALPPIPCEFISKEYLLSFPQRTNLAWVDVFSTKRLESSVFYDLDRENDFTAIGFLQDRISNFRIPTRECNSIRIKVSEIGNDSGAVSSTSSLVDLPVLEGFNMEHTPKEKRDEMQSNTRRKRNVNGA